MFLKLHNNYGLEQSFTIFAFNIILKIWSTLCFQETILFFLYNYFKLLSYLFTSITRPSSFLQNEISHRMSYLNILVAPIVYDL